MDIKGHGHSLTLVQGQSIDLGPRSLRFNRETDRPIEAKFHVKPPWDGGTKMFSTSPGHMTIYDK